MRRGFDFATAREAFKGPGQDTRGWFCVGLVDKETPDAPSVTYDDDVGPLVSVTLQPSAMPIVCRVAAQVGGVGEGEWYPFVQGDEVFVGVLDGDPKAGGIILGRGTNGVDVEPKTVAGQDPKLNAFAWKRTVPPFIWEVADAWALRSATTGAMLRLGADGAWTIADGENDYLAVSPDFVTIQSKDASLILQIDMVGKRATVQAGASVLQLNDQADGYLSSFGALFLSANGASPNVHAVGIEQVISLFSAFFAAWTAPGMTGATFLTTLPAIIAAASSLPLSPLVKTALATALALPPDASGNRPGVGSSGILIG